MMIYSKYKSASSPTLPHPRTSDDGYGLIWAEVTTSIWIDLGRSNHIHNKGTQEKAPPEQNHQHFRSNKHTQLLLRSTRTTILEIKWIEWYSYYWCWNDIVRFMRKSVLIVLQPQACCCTLSWLLPWKEFILNNSGDTDEYYCYYCNFVLRPRWKPEKARPPRNVEGIQWSAQLV